MSIVNMLAIAANIATIAALFIDFIKSRESGSQLTIQNSSHTTLTSHTRITNQTININSRITNDDSSNIIILIVILLSSVSMAKIISIAILITMILLSITTCLAVLKKNNNIMFRKKFSITVICYLFLLTILGSVMSNTKFPFHSVNLQDLQSLSKILSIIKFNFIMVFKTSISQNPSQIFFIIISMTIVGLAIGIIIRGVKLVVAYWKEKVVRQNDLIIILIIVIIFCLAFYFNPFVSH